MVKIAQIGMGHDHAGMIFRGLRTRSDIFEVAGIYLPEEEKPMSYCYDMNVPEADGVKRLTLDEILNDKSITAVTIETSEKLLTKYALLAAKAGKHIHLDKPGGMDQKEFEELVGTAKKNKTVLHLGYMYRYNPEVMKLMRDIKNGELGEIISVEAQMSQIFESTPKKRQWLEQFKGGMMFFLGCHLVDLIVRIKGVPDNIVPFNKSTGLEGVTSEDFGMAVLEYKNGTSFAKTCAREVCGGARRQLVVHGSKKTVEIKPLELPAGILMRAKSTYYKDFDWQTDGETICPPFDRYDAMLESFAEMASGKKENPWSYEYELNVHKCVLKACGVI